MNNLYSNEVYCMFIFEKYLNLHNSIDIEKVYLLLPFIFDNKVMQKLSRIDKIPNLIDLVIKDSKIFMKQRKLYYEYFILTTNTLQLCIENGLIELEDRKVVLKTENILFDSFDFSDSTRSQKIIDNLEKISKLLKNEESYELYHALRIEV